MGGGKTCINPIVLTQGLFHLCNGLDIVVVRPYLATEVAEVDVAEDELAVIFEDVANLEEFRALFAAAHIFEETEGSYKIESAIIEDDWFLGDVDFSQKGRWLMNGDVDAAVFDVLTQQRP